MRWNNRPKIERPEYPKMIAIAATADEAQEVLRVLQQSDPDAALVPAGDRGLYIRVHNEAAELAAKKYAEARVFPLA